MSRTFLLDKYKILHTHNNMYYIFFSFLIYCIVSITFYAILKIYPKQYAKGLHLLPYYIAIYIVKEPLKATLKVKKHFTKTMRKLKYIFLKTMRSKTMRKLKKLKFSARKSNIIKLFFK